MFGGLINALMGASQPEGGDREYGAPPRSKREQKARAKNKMGKKSRRKNRRRHGKGI